MPEEASDVVDIELGGVLLRDDAQEFRQRQLSLAADRIRRREEFRRTPPRLPRHVAFAADRQQQRMDSGGIDRVDAVDAWKDGRDDRAGQLVDEGPETRVLLRRPADDRERPDRVLAAIDFLDRE